MERYTLLCFGVARDLTGGGSITLALPEKATVADLRSAIIAEYPAFSELVSFAIARNEAYATDGEELAVGDTLAIIPPVSGG